MRIGVPKETAPGERRVALTPGVVEKLVPKGHQVVVEVRRPSKDEEARLRDGTVLVGLLQPLTEPDAIERLAARGVTAFALESIPRITRAQPMDALSSQATIAGYK